MFLPLSHTGSEQLELQMAYLVHLCGPKLSKYAINVQQSHIQKLSPAQDCPKDGIEHVHSLPMKFRGENNQTTEHVEMTNRIKLRKVQGIIRNFLMRHVEERF